MIRYLDPLYTTDKTKSKCEKVKKSLKTGAGLIGIYIITLAETDKDVFDIYNVVLFKQRYFRHRDYDIIGIAENEEAAYELVKKIYIDYFNDYKTYDGIKTELKSRLDV